MSYPQLLTPEEKLADAKKLLSLPRIVVICGSTRFMTEMTEADLRETKAGKIVVKPGCDLKSPHELWLLQRAWQHGEDIITLHDRQSRS